MMNRVIQIARYGGPEELQVVEAAVGEPGPGQIRIRHLAIGLNFTDVYQRTGVHPVKYPFPMRLGMEAANFGDASGPAPPMSIRDLGGESLYVTRQTVFNFLTSREATQAMADDLFDQVGSGG